MRSSRIALALVTIRKAHGDTSQRPDSAHNVGRINFVREQIRLDASDDIGARRDV